MTLRDCISRLVERRDLSAEEAAAAMHALMSGEATAAQTAAFLTALRMKGETVEEISALATVMRRFAAQVKTQRRPLVDTCGTGGDRSHSFNISTAAAFVVAATGIAVAKHGNRSATSLCGSADVLEALGVNIELSPERVAQCIDTVGIGFLFARTMHAAMKHVAPIRAELGFRTVFNILGPLTNPAGADGQVIGVFDANLLRTLAEVLLRLGTRHSFVVAGGDGLDEITLDGPTRVAEAVDGTVMEYEVRPAQFGLTEQPASTLRGGDPARNAEILRAILAGAPGPHRDVVLLNAAPAIIAGGKAADWAEGIAAAQVALDSGAAQAKLDALIKFTHDS
jgi:anthranilate phosphoribosyltransferase